MIPQKQSTSESAKQSRIGSGISFSGAIIALITFFLPWVSVDCSRSTRITATGLSAALGTYAKDVESYSSLLISLFVITVVLLISITYIARPFKNVIPVGLFIILSGVLIIILSAANIYIGLSRLMNKFGESAIRNTTFHDSIYIHVVGGVLVIIGGVAMIVIYLWRKKKKRSTGDLAISNPKSEEIYKSTCLKCGMEYVVESGSKFCEECGGELASQTGTENR